MAANLRKKFETLAGCLKRGNLGSRKSKSFVICENPGFLKRIELLTGVFTHSTYCWQLCFQLG